MIKCPIVQSDRLENPDAEEVFRALRNCYGPSPMAVRFWVLLEGQKKSIGQAIEVRISGLEYESGSPGMFILSGYLTDSAGINGHVRFRGFYNANRKTGAMALFRANESVTF